MRLTQYETNGGLTIEYISGYILFLVNIILFIHLFLIKVINTLSIPIWQIIIGVFVFFIGKHVINRVASQIFEYEKEAKAYGFTIITIRNILSVIFLSINILMVFGPEIWARPLTIFGVGLFIIFLISRYYKGVRIARVYINDTFFQFFIYFCAFEFSPWCVVFKFIKDNI